MKYTIVLVNYKNWQDTLECVQSLLDAGIPASAIMIVENASSDNSISELNKRLKDVYILENTENLGFSGANNQGIRYSLDNGSDYIILLNNDTIVKKDSIRILLSEMEKDREASLGTGQIRYYPESNRIWYAGGKLIGWRGLAIHMMESRVVEEAVEESKNSYVDFISGCYLCIRSSAIRDLGLLNEKFFLYLEDIEYSARAVKRNHKLLYVPSSVIYHKCRGERKLKEQTLYYAVRNRKLLIDLVFPSMAKIYFNLVIGYKMILWFIKDKKLFQAARMGLKDYRNNKFGPIDLDMFDTSKNHL